MGKLLTVSVAAYNMEKYIGQCLDSLAVPEIADALEVFVIDDGGTDATLDIARRYAAKYPGTFIPVHKENGGWGSTMNYSVAHATGKYFKFLDGDDWFDREGLVKLVSALESTDADVVLTTKICKGPDRDSMKTDPHYKVIDGTRIRVRDMPGDQIFSGTHITCKTEIIKRSNILFPEHLYYTDTYYFSMPFAHARDVLYLDCLLYCYRIGRDGQSVSRKQRIRHKDDMLANTINLSRFCRQKQLEGNKNIGYILRRVARTYLLAVRTILLQPVSKDTQQELIQFEDRMKDICPEIRKQARTIRGETALLLKLLDITHYKAYWLLKVLPGGMPNFK